MQFIYFVPGVKTGTAARHAIGEAGAADLLYDSMAANQVAAGPSGPGGVMLAESCPTSYDPKGQEWFEVPGGAYSVGMCRDGLPRPSDLARKNQLAGFAVRLGDANEWLIPAARAWGFEDGELKWQPALPRLRSFGDDGKWHAGEVMQRHRPLWEAVVRTASAVKRLASGDDAVVAEITVQSETDLAVLALRTNYRVGPVEASLLSLLTTESVAAIYDALVGGPQLRVLTETIGTAEASEAPAEVTHQEAKCGS